MREPVTTLTLDTPAGPVPVEARCRDGKVERVQFTNVPCFATHLGAKLDVENSRKWLLYDEANHKLNSDGDFFQKENYLKLENTNLSARDAALRIAHVFGLTDGEAVARG